MIVFFFSLWMTVSLGQQTKDDCIQRYTQCAQQTLSVKGTDRCRSTNAFMECLTDVTEQCYPELVDAVTDYHNLIQEGCSPDSTLINDVMVTGQCISTNIQQFQHCRLEGEFETLAEFCSSIGHLTECLRLKTESLCSMKYGKVFQRVIKPITELTGICERSQANKAYILPECDRALLRCGRDIVNPKGFGCIDVEMKVTCYMEAVHNDCDKKTVGPYLPILERYIAQIPQYCNPESAFRKNLGKSYSCIFENLSVILPCHDVHRGNLKKVVAYSYDHSDQLVMAIIRTNLQHYHCMIEKLGAACGKEAEYVTRYMLSPIESTMEERCKELTGEKCNGSAASGCSFVLLILSLAYILTKEDERI